ncbi:hypothetical protein RB195_001196 [Necator americanus]|uniref:Peptidase A2 domain-containing protein n=1 Tax=Necator americanus TaxID=51031 RepID=A0ABR1DDL6_NECAM
MVEQLLAEATADHLINPVGAAHTIEVKAVTAEPPWTNFGESRMFSASMVFPTVDLFLVARTVSINCGGLGHHARQCPSLTVQLPAPVVNGVLILALIDTGAAITITSRDTAPLLGVFAMGDSDIPCAIGMAGVPIKLSGRADLRFERSHKRYTRCQIGMSIQSSKLSMTPRSFEINDVMIAKTRHVNQLRSRTDTTATNTFLDVFDLLLDSASKDNGATPTVGSSQRKQRLRQPHCRLQAD